MSDSQKEGDIYDFPRRINEPTMLAFFPMKQILPTLGIFFTLAYFGAFWIGLILSGACFWTVGRIIKNSYFDVIIHKYWKKGWLDVMVGLNKTSTVVNPMVKRFFN